jgi:hypothetical protein
MPLGHVWLQLWIIWSADVACMLPVNVLDFLLETVGRVTCLVGVCQEKSNDKR